MAAAPHKFNFRPIQIANEQRNAYGLRYNDFNRYRKHCANRTHRLRSSLKMGHGKGREFKKLPPITPEIAKDGHLQLLLFEAERAWAYAQELSSSALLPANSKHAGSLRHSATGRFRRAIHWSTQLLSICQALHASGRLSSENLIETNIYMVILNGRFLRFRDEFEDAVIQLSVARGLLDKLADTAPTSRDQALAVLFSDEIGPEIRHCAHELGHKKAYDVNSIVAELYPKYRNEIVAGCDELISKLEAEQNSSSKSNLAERLWDGQPVPVRFPELVDVFVKLEAAEKTLEGVQQDSKKPGGGSKRSKLGVTAYDSVLSALSDAEEVSRKLKEANQITAVKNATTNSGRDIHFVHAYIVYQLLARRIQRDLVLMNTLLASEAAEKPKYGKKPAGSVDARLYPAVVKLLDTILQSFSQMRTLSIVDDNPDLLSAIEARIAFASARRCLYLAQCYAAVRRYAEALALHQHATIHIRETTSSLSLSDRDLINGGTPDFFPLLTEDIKALEAILAKDSTQFKRDWFAFNGGSPSTDSSGHKKPLFFNIALNYVQLDMDRLQERAGKAPPPPVASKAEVVPEKKPAPKAKVEEQREPSPEPQPQPAPTRSGLGSLLGGWWSKSS
ncbi:hypothetical protein CVT24_011310 [Panaeolus cyanescens]|uniref:Signal recognition particle subunit SRP68 n=1 Tax=Panaeolus cyanescens TaxID=181874 RepID=A0A409VLD0_9AGAR|nr:hypothetical protein CVT24_011310 [Panaeolus cyanescens]